MSVSDSGAWKLLIIPVIIIIVIGLIINVTISPFVKAGIPVNSQDSKYINSLSNIIEGHSNFTLTNTTIDSNTQTISGTEAIFGWLASLVGILKIENNNQTITDQNNVTYKVYDVSINKGNIFGDTATFLLEQQLAFHYIPEPIQTALLVILVICFSYIIIVIITMFIP